MRKLYGWNLASPVRLLCLGLLIGVTTACGPDATTPTTPSSPTTPGSGAGPGAQLTVVVDSLGSEEAVMALSDVAFDASGSTGSGSLTYRLDFGDGASTTTPTARHVYSAPGGYTATVTVTDATGKTTTASRPVVVRSVTGAWLHAAFSPGSGHAEVRRVRLTTQTGLRVEGVVQIPGRPDRAITGELTAPRSLRLLLEDREFGALEGVVPSLVGGPGPWELRATGGVASGERLAFRAVEADPTGPGPDAVLKMRFFSFSAPYGIQGFSPILFDGSTSRGEGLRYFLEFGDGEISVDPSAVHPIARFGRYTARLTVVDRFGRTDTETPAFFVTTLVDSNGSGWFTRGLWLKFTSQPDHRLNGVATVGSSPSTLAPGLTDGLVQNAQFSGTLSGERDIRIAVDGSDIVLTGTLTLGFSAGDARMFLTQSGGADHGRSYTLGFSPGH